MTNEGLKEDTTLSKWIPFTDDIEFVIAKDKVVVITLASVDLAHYYEVVLAKVEATDAKIRPALSADDIDKILEIADEEDEELLEWDEEGNNVIGGHIIDSKKFH
jgi:predicted class III extradiol MEMO1 family dioxygenase